MRYLSIAIGTALGWMGGQLLLFVRDLLTLHGPERSFPAIAPLIDRFVIGITAVALGGILGWVGHTCVMATEKKQPRVCPKRFSYWWICVATLTVVLAIDALGIPLWHRFFQMRAAQRWQAEQLKNNQHIVQLLIDWNTQNSIASRNEATQIQVLTSSVISDTQWNECTAAWSDDAWNAFARLALKAPAQMVAYQVPLMDKLLTHSTSSDLRETLLDATFSIAIATNDTNNFWKQIERLDETKEVMSQLFTTQLSRERIADSKRVPWWLFEDSAMRRFEMYVPTDQALLSELASVLKRLESSQIDQNDDGLQRLDRLRAIIDRR